MMGIQWNSGSNTACYGTCYPTSRFSVAVAARITGMSRQSHGHAMNTELLDE
jgi:hypothetical protein